MKFNIVHEKSLDFFIGQKIHIVRDHVNYGYGVIEKLNPVRAKVKIVQAEKRFKVNTVVTVQYDFIFKLV